MKVILVGDAPYRESTINKILLQKLTPRNNIIECNSISDAEVFLSNQIANQGINKHVDLIIVDDIISGSIYQKNLCDWLRSYDEPFSNNNFRLSSLPVILYKNGVNKNSTSSHFYNEVISLSNDYTGDKLGDASLRIVRNWRESILSDLAVLKIDNNYLRSIKTVDFLPINEDYRSIKNNYGYYFQKTSVVSNDFIKNPRFLRYDWMLSNKLFKIETSLDKYYKIIKGLHSYKGRSLEREVLHKFYLNNPFFLQKDVYKRQVYEKRFYVSTKSKYHIPDFILESPFPRHTPTSISEIKRHNIDFEYIPKKHENFTKYTEKALNQASNYEDDFLDAKMFNKNFQVDLIIGLDDRLTEFIKRKMEKHFSTINIVTHDNLMNEVEEYYKRLKSLSVRRF